MKALANCLPLMHPDNTFFFFTSVPRFHSCVFPAQQCGLKGSDCRLWGGRFFLHPYPHKPRRHRSAITGVKPSSTSGKEAIPQYFPSAPQPPLKPAPNTTTTQLMGTGRSQRRSGPTLVFTANTNRGRLEYRALPLSSERLVCGCLVCSKKEKKMIW